jgi:hypothetical protein
MDLWLRYKSIVAKGNYSHIVQVKTSRPAVRLSLYLLGAFENQLSSVNLIFIIVGVIGFFFDNSGKVIVIKDVGNGDKGTRVHKVGDKAKGSVPERVDGNVLKGAKVFRKGG